MPAPVASGWSARRAGLAPVGKAPSCHGARGFGSFPICPACDAQPSKSVIHCLKPTPRQPGHCAYLTAAARSFRGGRGRFVQASKHWSRLFTRTVFMLQSRSYTGFNHHLGDRENPLPPRRFLNTTKVLFAPPGRSASGFCGIITASIEPGHDRTASDFSDLICRTGRTYLPAPRSNCSPPYGAVAEALDVNDQHCNQSRHRP